MAKNPVFLAAGFEDAGDREALGRLTSASPYSSIKVSNTSLDHLLLGKAADCKIMRLYLAAGNSVFGQLLIGTWKFGSRAWRCNRYRCV
jgi:hypothetical protein